MTTFLFLRFLALFRVSCSIATPFDNISVSDELIDSHAILILGKSSSVNLSIMTIIICKRSWRINTVYYDTVSTNDNYINLYRCSPGVSSGAVLFNINIAPLFEINSLISKKGEII